MSKYSIIATIISLAIASSVYGQFRQPQCAKVQDGLSPVIYSAYGSVFSARGVVKPSACYFAAETEVERFQKSVKVKSAIIGSTAIELQEPAMNALLSAIRDAGKLGLSITPRGGKLAAKRSFADTLRLWNSRFIPALKHWVAVRKIGRADAERVRTETVAKQLRQVLDWETRGLYFGTNRNGPIMSSVAPPGTSQHLTMLALDVSQFGNKRVREILNRHGWYQTVLNDLPHFTFIGLPEKELPNHGLRAVESSGYTFWIPR